VNCAFTQWSNGPNQRIMFSSNQVNYFGIAYLTYEKKKRQKKRRKKPLYYICQWLTNIWVGGDQGTILPRIAQKRIL